MVFVYVWGAWSMDGGWMPLPPVRNDIVTPRHLFFCSSNISSYPSHRIGSGFHILSVYLTIHFSLGWTTWNFEGTHECHFSEKNLVPEKKLKIQKATAESTEMLQWIAITDLISMHSPLPLPLTIIDGGFLVSMKNSMNDFYLSITKSFFYVVVVIALLWFISV